MARPLNVATPVDPVVAVALLSVAPPGPDAIVAVTVTVAWLTGFPLASRSWITGCCAKGTPRSEEHTSELQSRPHLVCRLLLEKKNAERAIRIQTSMVTAWMELSSS